jgi:hypothetical protein
MTIDYDQEFGPSGRYPWPGYIDIAEGVIKVAVAPCKKSSSDCLTQYFFERCLADLEEKLLEDYPEEEASELKEAALRERQELFKDARGWPLSCLVTSAVYYIFSTDAERVYMISGDLLWLFLSFDKPLLDMFQSKGWDKKYQDELREGFMCKIIFDFTSNRLLWGSNEERPWFTCEGFIRHIYPEDVLRCLDLVGIDQTLARWAVDEVFKLHNLTPFWAVLYNDPDQARRIMKYKK